MRWSFRLKSCDGRARERSNSSSKPVFGIKSFWMKNSSTWSSRVHVMRWLPNTIYCLSCTVMPLALLKLIAPWSCIWWKVVQYWFRLIRTSAALTPWGMIVIPCNNYHTMVNSSATHWCMNDSSLARCACDLAQNKMSILLLASTVISWGSAANICSLFLEN